MWKTYFSPITINETLALLTAHQGKAKIANGTTDLFLELEKGIYPFIDILIDITHIPGNDYIRRDQDGTIHIGPGVTHNQVVTSSIIREFALPLAEASFSVGSPQIRNRGTVAGNLITASPANDTISPLIALDAKVTLRSVRGERVLNLKDFYKGVRRTILETDELLTDIFFQGLGPDTLSSFQKFALRRAQAIALVNSTVILRMDKDIIEDASITLGAVAPTIIHAEEAENFLRSKVLDEPVIKKAADLAMNSSKPITDLRSSAPYRDKIVRILVERSLKSLARREKSPIMPESPINLWGKQGIKKNIYLQSMSHDENTPIITTINGKRMVFQSGQEKSLLRLIREEGLLVGTKEGCDEGECGACTIFLDGLAVMSCLVPAPRAHGAEIRTIEGISEGNDLHPVQRAFIEKDAVQCGYCTPGFIMSAVKLLEEREKPTREEIKQAITGNLCRCTGYYKIIEAIETAVNFSS
jgi:xanthine dehydrogenase iron-sulfur cluster and FAD-binding subunit A